MQSVSHLLIVAVILGFNPVPLFGQVFKFKLQSGEKLTYESEFTHAVETKVGMETQVSNSKLTQTRRWEVISVDNLGVATMELTVLSMRMERKDPDGKVMLFDSNDLGASDEPLVKQLSKAVGKPILRVQIGANGALKGAKQLTDVKSVFPELPFQVSMPDEYVREGLKWRREFAVPLEAPLGRGEAFQAYQLCEITRVSNDRLIIETETKMDKEPTDAAAKIALAQFLPKGKVLLDLKRGKMLQALMTTERKVDDIEGAGSYYKFTSKSTERLIETPEAARKD